MDRSEEFEVKRERVGAFLSENRLSGLVLGRTDNFAWLGCGADSVVSSSSETGVGTFVVTREGVTLIANNIETERLLSEEIAGLDLADVKTFDWHAPDTREVIIEDMVGSADFAADDGSCDLPPLQDAFKRLRYTLTSAEVERYKELGCDSSEAMEAAARRVEKGMLECEAAALIAQEHLKRGVNPIVVLVAADERIRKWRHPIPKDQAIEQYVMLVACGRRKGLVSALTRFVHFGEMPAELRRRHRAVCEVDATMMLNTKPGRTAAEVFEIAQNAYAKVCFPNEWRLHHQGGAIGYQPREYIANPACPEAVLPNQAFAWNPSICGTKSEDTILVKEEIVEVLTSPSADWPALELEVEGETMRRADMLIK